MFTDLIAACEKKLAAYKENDPAFFKNEKLKNAIQILKKMAVSQPISQTEHTFLLQSKIIAENKQVKSYPHVFGLSLKKIHRITLFLPFKDYPSKLQAELIELLKYTKLTIDQIEFLFGDQEQEGYIINLINKSLTNPDEKKELIFLQNKNINYCKVLIEICGEYEDSMADDLLQLIKLHLQFIKQIRCFESLPPEPIIKSMVQDWSLQDYLNKIKLLLQNVGIQNAKQLEQVEKQLKTPILLSRLPKAEQMALDNAKFVYTGLLALKKTDLLNFDNTQLLLEKGIGILLCNFFPVLEQVKLLNESMFHLILNHKLSKLYDNMLLKCFLLLAEYKALIRITFIRLYQSKDYITLCKIYDLLAKHIEKQPAFSISIIDEIFNQAEKKIDLDIRPSFQL